MAGRDGLPIIIIIIVMTIYMHFNAAILLQGCLTGNYQME